MIFEYLVEAVLGGDHLAARVRRGVHPRPHVLKRDDRQRNDLRRSIGEMKRHAGSSIGDGIDALAFGQVGRQADDALIDIIEIAIDLGRAVRRPRAGAPGPVVT